MATPPSWLQIMRKLNKRTTESEFHGLRWLSALATVNLLTLGIASGFRIHRAKMLQSEKLLLQNHILISSAADSQTLNQKLAPASAKRFLNIWANVGNTWSWCTRARTSFRVCRSSCWVESALDRFDKPQFSSQDDLFTQFPWLRKGNKKSKLGLHSKSLLRTSRTFDNLAAAGGCEFPLARTRVTVNLCEESAYENHQIIDYFHDNSTQYLATFHAMRFQREGFTGKKGILSDSW